MTVRDPRHPLFGRRFRVAQCTVGPGREGRFLLVFYRDGDLLRIPVSATVRPAFETLPTKLNLDALSDLVAAVGGWRL